MKSLRHLTSVTLFTLCAFAVPMTLAYAGPPPPPPGKKDAPPPPPKGKGDAPPPPSGDVPPSAGGVPPSGNLNAPPSGKLQAAEDLYKADNPDSYSKAAVAFAEAASAQIPGDTPRGQFWLGKSLYKLGFYASSLSVFSEIVDAGTGHPYHKLTLPWLASLSRELPESAGVLEKIGQYKSTDLEDEAFDEVRDELYYLTGRYNYNKGDLAKSISMLGLVPDDSDYYIPAQFFLGVAETRELHGTQAVEAFKNVLRKNIELRQAFDKDKKKRKKEEKKRKKELKKLKKQNPKLVVDKELVSYEEEMQRFEERANLSLGYIFYQVGKFETAIKYFDKIPQDSPYWLDSILASAWSEFRLVEVEPERANLHYQRTLGYIHTLNAPFFYDYLYPEAVVLKAVTYYFNCRYSVARTSIDEFMRRYPETKNKLQSVLDQAPEDFAFYEFSIKIREGESGLDPFVEEVAQKSLQDKTLEKNYAYVKELEREAALLESMSSEFKSSAAGDRVTEDLDGLTSLAKETTGGLARKRLQSQISEIYNLEREAIKIEYEVLNRIKAGEDTAPENRRPDKPKIDREHEIYNYNGEYWKDELGYYNYQVTSLCKEE